MRQLVYVAVVALSHLVIGCGEDAESTGGEGDDTPCGRAAKTLCDASCDCTPECRIRFDSGSTQSFGNEVSSPREQCLSAFTNSCNDAGLDPDTCEADIANADCGQGGSNPALALPTSCTP
jgi:hypothetical protein